VPYRNECPECRGRGYVPRGYYDDGVGDPTDTPESCKMCEGSGQLVSPDPDPHVATTPAPDPPRPAA
jgi:DnaJ-class molecular chaperone